MDRSPSTAGSTPPDGRALRWSGTPRPSTTPPCLLRRTPGTDLPATAPPGNGGDFGTAVFTAIDNDRWMPSFAGSGDYRPGPDIEDVLRRCREDLPDVFRRIAACEPLGDVRTYQRHDSRRHDNAAAERLPGGTFVVGGAAASFNPIHGQGLSSAALHATCLSMHLRSGRSVHERADYYFQLRGIVTDAAWDRSTFGVNEPWCCRAFVRLPGFHQHGRSPVDRCAGLSGPTAIGECDGDRPGALETGDDPCDEGAFSRVRPGASFAERNAVSNGQYRGEFREDRRPLEGCGC